MTDQEVQDQIDEWYDMDGRNDPAHPFHARYTGLKEKYALTINDCSARLDDQGGCPAGDDPAVQRGAAEPSEL
jgi:hypothetical protein